MLKLLALKDAYLKNEDGATAIEYGLIAAGVSVAIVAIVFALGENIQTAFTTVNDEITGGGAP